MYYYDSNIIITYLYYHVSNKICVSDTDICVIAVMQPVNVFYNKLYSLACELVYMFKKNNKVTHLLNTDLGWPLKIIILLDMKLNI